MESIKEFPRGINSDQVISLIKPDGENESVHPGPGLELSSFKLELTSTKLTKRQATSFKPQAQRLKLQAASFKLQD